MIKEEEEGKTKEEKGEDEEKLEGKFIWYSKREEAEEEVEE